MFDFFKKKKKEEPAQVNAPEIMGLYINGSFQLNDLKLRLIEDKLTFANAHRNQLIQAIGEIKLDESTTLLRFYTDDDGFLQVVCKGGLTENHIDDVKLFFFHDTQGISSQNQWNKVLDEHVSQPTYLLENNAFTRVWEEMGASSPPVAMTEKTYMQDGSTSITDQFIMLYEREVDDNLFEFLLVSAEEKIIDNQYDRCLVESVGINLTSSDIEIIG
ncbi:YjfK family protein [Zooshikella sp. RANM57]|uniref:YjfK family protein n=1 Tax=Zooshikella sp. RANM57 TaxID=3425863 RepID=UPI003D7006A5